MFAIAFPSCPMLTLEKMSAKIPPTRRRGKPTAPCGAPCAPPAPVNWGTRKAAVMTNGIARKGTISLLLVSPLRSFLIRADSIAEKPTLWRAPLDGAYSPCETVTDTGEGDQNLDLTLTAAHVMNPANPTESPANASDNSAAPSRASLT